MFGALIDDLARGVDVLDFRDGENGRAALRPFQQTVLDQPALPRFQATLEPIRRSLCWASTIAPDRASRIL